MFVRIVATGFVCVATGPYLCLFRVYREADRTSETPGLPTASAVLSVGATGTFVCELSYKQTSASMAWIPLIMSIVAERYEATLTAHQSRCLHLVHTKKLKGFAAMSLENESGGIGENIGKISS